MCRHCAFTLLCCFWSLLFAVNEERGAFGGTWTRGKVFDVTRKGRRWQCICWWAYRLVRKGMVQYFTVPLVVCTDSAQTAWTAGNPSKVHAESEQSIQSPYRVQGQSTDSTQTP